MYETLCVCILLVSVSLPIFLIVNGYFNSLYSALISFAPQFLMWISSRNPPTLQSVDM